MAVPLSCGLAQGLGRCVDQLVGEAMGQGLERLLGILALLQGQQGLLGRLHRWRQ